MSTNIRRLVRPNVLALTAYEAREVPCRIKLDANESPYGPTKAELRRMCTRLGRMELNRYPDPEAVTVRSLLAKRLRLSRDQILLGNGSDELISLLITTFGGPVLYPVPTFSMYGIIGRGLGERTVEVGLDGQFDLDLPAMLRAIRREKPRLVFLSSPNNPTGNGFSTDRIEAILKAASGIVVVDEAYRPFAAGPGFVSRLAAYPKLVVLQTLSKVGLAALRVGLLAAFPSIVHEVNKVRLPFNVNALSQMAAAEALSGRTLEASATRVSRERQRLFNGMSRLSGVQTFPSDANFILFRTQDPGRVHRKLLRQGILIRNLDAVVPGCLRVTVGSPEENREFLLALEKSVK